MTYVISFLEGIVTFVSPCILPMLPIYVAYFAGGVQNDPAPTATTATTTTTATATTTAASVTTAINTPTAATASTTAETTTIQASKVTRKKTLMSAVGFVLGFTIVFVVLGAFSGTLGSFLTSHQAALNIVCGLIVIVFGLNFIGILNIGILNRTLRATSNVHPTSFASSILFGFVFAASWTPCVGAFLGSALLLAAQQGSMLQGIIMLVCYSLGLGIPFILSALLVYQLEDAFAVIKRHYRVINIVCGAFLVLVGILMATGLLGNFLSLLSI